MSGLLNFEEGTPDQSLMWRSIRSVGPIGSATETISTVAADPKVRPKLRSGFIEPGEFLLEKMRTINFLNIQKVFLRGRTVFLVGVSKHGSQMRDKGEAWTLANRNPGTT
jgi:hypothetical protein